MVIFYFNFGCELLVFLSPRIAGGRCFFGVGAAAATRTNFDLKVFTEMEKEHIGRYLNCARVATSSSSRSAASSLKAAKQAT